MAKTKPVIACPYCSSGHIIKKGQRKKKYERIQLYFCHRCQRKFTPLINKHHSYPLSVILDAVTLYNRFYSMQDAARIVGESYGIPVRHQTLAKWLKDFRPYLPVLRLRNTIQAKYDTHKIFIESRLFHGQIYHFKTHYAKADLITNQPKHAAFQPVKTFLEAVPTECPHKLFKAASISSSRSSKYQNIFNLDQVEIVSKPHNAATTNAGFVLQAVSKNKLRHERLQEFMLTNDSATVAVEIPVVLTPEDLRHFKERLHFELPLELGKQGVITGHIDILQIRNGMAHILDYKPGAKQVQPIEQLTIYALALSRQTGLPLLRFKCAWFDEKDYFEFYPLKVVHKLKHRNR